MIITWLAGACLSQKSTMNLQNWNCRINWDSWTLLIMQSNSENGLGFKNIPFVEQIEILRVVGSITRHQRTICETSAASTYYGFDPDRRSCSFRDVWISFSSYETKGLPCPTHMTPIKIVHFFLFKLKIQKRKTKTRMKRCVLYLRWGASYLALQTINNFKSFHGPSFIGTYNFASVPATQNPYK